MKTFHVAQVGTFDAKSLEDQLLPFILKEAFNHENAGIQMDLFSSAGRKMSFFPGYTVYPITALPERHSEVHYDAIIIGGGSIIRLGEKKASLETQAVEDSALMLWAYPILVGLQKNIPVLFNAPGVPCAFTTQQRSCVRMLLQAVDYVSVCDELSRDFLKQAGYEGKATIVPDIICLSSQLFPADTLPLPQALSKVALSPDKPYALLQLKALDQGKDTAACLQLIRRYHEEMNCDIVLMPIGCVQDDCKVMQSLWKQVHQAFDFVYDPKEELTPFEHMALLSHAQGFVGASLDDCLLSLLYGVPTLCLDCAGTTKDFFSMMDQERYVCEGMNAALWKLPMLKCMKVKDTVQVQDRVWTHIRELIRRTGSAKQADNMLQEMVRSILQGTSPEDIQEKQSSPLPMQLSEPDRAMQKLRQEVAMLTKTSEENRLKHEAKIAEMGTLIEHYQRENQELAAAAYKAQYDYQLISNSQWWRLTAPGRKLLIAMKRNKLGVLAFKVLKSLKNQGVQQTIDKVVSFIRRKTAPGSQLPFPSENAFVSQLRKHPNVNCRLSSLNAYLKDVKPYQYRVLFVCHEMSLSGAPVVLLNFARMVQESGHQVVFVAPVDGPLRAEAEKAGISAAIIPDLFTAGDTLDLAYPFHLVVACTIASAPLVRDLNGTDIPVLWWIHEAKVSYHPGYLVNMPQKLESNIHVYSVCEYARKLLLRYRPQYSSGILPYYMADFAQLKSSSGFALPPHAGKTVFTMVGTMEERKGQDILVQAIRLLPRSIMDQCLFVIVSRKHHKSYEILIDELCRDDPQHVLYFEQLSREQIADLYRESDCQICSSRDDPMPCVITEALSVGKPSICSEHTGYAAILQKMQSGLVYQNDDPALLAEAIERFVLSHEVQHQLQANARATYEKYFTQETFNRNVTAILNKLLLKLTDEECSEYDLSAMSFREALEQTSPVSATVSVVIPTYNPGEVFETLLNKLKEQRGLERLEIIIVDSGSRDQTIDVCRRHGVRLFQIPNEEFSHSGARNMGAYAATGDILLFMTQDAQPVSTTWIAQLIDPILNEHVAAVSPREKCPEGPDLYYRVASCSHSRFLGIETEDRLNEGLGKGDRMSVRASAALNDVTTAINRRVFLRFGYRYDFAEDLDMGLRLVRSGYRIKLLAGTQTLHGHNRPAGYYFRRSLVDAVTTSDTILQMHLRGTQTQDVLTDILTQGYGTMQQVLQTILEADCNSLNDFSDVLLRAIARAETLSAHDRRHMPTCVPLQDDVLRQVVEILMRYCPNSPTPHSEITQAICDYWKGVLMPYVKDNELWQPALKMQLLDCLNKQLASVMGSELVYLSPDAPVYNEIHLFTAGV